jgi:hypothetical protein
MKKFANVRMSGEELVDMPDVLPLCELRCEGCGKHGQSIRMDKIHIFASDEIAEPVDPLKDFHRETWQLRGVQIAAAENS